MVLLPLLSVLSLVAPNEGGDAEWTKEDEVAPAPAPTPAPAPASTKAAPPADAPARPGPRYKGTGLLATTGVLAGASLGVTIARNVLLKKNCPLDTSSAQCTYDINSDIGLAATQWTLNFATVGFAAGSGVMLARYHAWKDAGDGRMRNRKALMATGGALVGVGIAGMATSIALAFVLPTNCADKELESGDPLAGDKCLLKVYPAWTMTNWTSFAMISSGSGMLAYGSVYGRNRERKTAKIRMAPFAGRTYAGFGMSGVF